MSKRVWAVAAYKRRNGQYGNPKEVVYVPDRMWRAKSRRLFHTWAAADKFASETRDAKWWRIVYTPGRKPKRITVYKIN